MRIVRPHWILLVESLGFVVVITFAWLNELVDVPSLLYGRPKHALEWQESGAASVLILAVALVVLVLTRRLLQRIEYLESIVKVCPGCQRVHHDGVWLPLASYVKKHFNAVMAHDLCPDCAAQLKADLKQVRLNLELLKH